MIAAARSREAEAAFAPTWAAGLEQPGRLRLLVVEDDEADAYLIHRALLGHPAVGEVTRARDGAEALRMIELGVVEPDLAFIDLHMPRKNGFSLLIALACRPPPAFPMVVLTSSAVTSDAVRGRLRGAARVITKRDTVEELRTVLASVIDETYPRAGRSMQAPPAVAALAPSPVPAPGPSMWWRRAGALMARVRAYPAVLRRRLSGFSLRLHVFARHSDQ